MLLLNCISQSWQMQLGVGEEQGSAYWRAQDRYSAIMVQWVTESQSGLGWKGPERTPSFHCQPCQDAGRQSVLQAALLLPSSSTAPLLEQWRSLIVLWAERSRNSRRGKVPFEAHGTKSFPVTMATAQWVPSLRTKLLQPCLKNKKSLKEGKRGRWGRGCGGEKLKQN